MGKVMDIHRIGLVCEETPTSNQPNPREMKKWKEKGWVYVKANDTDLRKTFARIRREQAAAQRKARK